MVDEDEKPQRESKLKLKATWREISHKQKGLLLLMVALAVMTVVVLIAMALVLHPQSSVVIVGYSDVYGEITGLTGGYRRDSWLNLLAFPLLAVVFGLVHAVIAMRLYQKYGKETALMVVIASMVLFAGMMVTLLRLVGEW